MLDLKVVEELVKPFIDENNFSLYSIEWANEFGYKILRVCVDKTGGINSDELGIVNEYLSEKLDKYEKELPENYMLEVSSPGAEKPLRNEEEVASSVGQKIHVTLESVEYEGKLLSFSEGIIELGINLKGRIKKIKVSYCDAKEIRLAV
jgi:ribosome maturation factor RimP